MVSSDGEIGLVCDIRMRGNVNRNRQKLMKRKGAIRGGGKVGVTFVLLSQIAWLIAVVRLRPALSIDFPLTCHCNDKMLAEGRSFPLVFPV